LQANHEFDARGSTGINGQYGLLQVGCDGFLAKYVLPVFGTGNDLFRVELTRGTNPNCLNFRMGNDIISVRAVLFELELFCRLSGAFNGRVGADTVASIFILLIKRTKKSGHEYEC